MMMMMEPLIEKNGRKKKQHKNWMNGYIYAA